MSISECLLFPARIWYWPKFALYKRLPRQKRNIRFSERELLKIESKLLTPGTYNVCFSPSSVIQTVLIEVIKSYSIDTELSYYRITYPHEICISRAARDYGNWVMTY